MCVAPPTTAPPATQPPITQPTKPQQQEADSKTKPKNKNVAKITSNEKEEDDKEPKDHTGRVAAAIFIGVTFSLSVCGLVSYKMYKANSERGTAPGGYSHPSKRLSNCLELQNASVSETRPIMQTTVETEGIDGLESDMPAYAV